MNRFLLMCHATFIAMLTVSACNCGDDPECELNTDCPMDFVCVDNMCLMRDDTDVRIDTPMSDAGDAGDGGQECSCLPSEICITGNVCVTPAGPCTTDADCGGDRYCCADGCALEGQPAQCIPYGSGPRGEVNEACEGVPPVGIFTPSVQCEWTAPPEGDAYPAHLNVLGTPMVADIGNDSGASGEIIFVSYNGTDGGAGAAAGDETFFGVIRIVSGQTCEQLETIALEPVIAAAPLAIGDLDGDGVSEIVALRVGGGLVAYKWNAESGAHEVYWTESGETYPANASFLRWDGPSIHDLNDDGIPEVLSRDEVYNGQTGARLNPSSPVSAPGNTGPFPIVADVDADGEVELFINDVYRWDNGMSQWVLEYDVDGTGLQHAVADFGSFVDGAFDPTRLDGRAELVFVNSDSNVSIYTLENQLVFASTAIGNTGSPPTIGDFDNDGFPEVAVAGGRSYGVLDLDCVDTGSGVPAGCESAGVRWTRQSQDASSSRTGSSIFDFEGDGQAEAVYADECFTRIYNGRSGEVLYSAYRTSCTWYENPVVADPDKDDNTEIIVGSNTNCGTTCGTRGTDYIDPIHRGLLCDTNDDCPTRTGCVDGLCRCTSNDQCDANTACVPPLSGTGDNVCRGVRPAGAASTGIRVLRDTLDRWVSSRPIWNQHAYSITNVEDNGTIPRSSARVRNFSMPEMNNYRQNAQGEAAPGDLADITGRLGDVCRQSGSETRLVSTVCNRGERAVGAALPATFYLGPPENGNVLCTSYTPGPVPVGGCLEVSCVLESSIENAEVFVQVNDDGMGGATTFECEAGNNRDSVMVEACGMLM